MSNMKPIIAKYIFKIILIIGLSFMYYLNEPVNTSKVLYIESGSINKIISQLKKNKYNVCRLDSLILRLLGSPQNGWINIGSKILSKADFLYKLTTAKAALVDVQLIPGETSYIFLNQLSKLLSLDRQILQKEYDLQTKIPEGSFFANTYSVPIGIKEDDLIRILLDKSLRDMKKLSYKLFGSYDKKQWIKYLSIASIIEKESANLQEMSLVSSVVQNRIKKGMHLQMDGALNYGKYSHIRVTAKRIREDDTIYNTYKHIGVPEYPVCNVGANAIKAAVFPATTEYLYFMKSSDGTHDFTVKYSEHLRNVKRATKRNK